NLLLRLARDETTLDFMDIVDLSVEERSGTISEATWPALVTNLTELYLDADGQISSAVSPEQRVFDSKLLALASAAAFTTEPALDPEPETDPEPDPKSMSNREWLEVVTPEAIRDLSVEEARSILRQGGLVPSDNSFSVLHDIAKVPAGQGISDRGWYMCASDLANIINERDAHGGYKDNPDEWMLHAKLMMLAAKASPEFTQEHDARRGGPAPSSADEREYNGYIRAGNFLFNKLREPGSVLAGTAFADAVASHPFQEFGPFPMDAYLAEITPEALQNTIRDVHNFGFSLDNETIKQALSEVKAYNEKYYAADLTIDLNEEPPMPDPEPPSEDQNDAPRSEEKKPAALNKMLAFFVLGGQALVRKLGGGLVTWWQRRRKAHQDSKLEAMKLKEAYKTIEKARNDPPLLYGLRSGPLAEKTSEDFRDANRQVEAWLREAHDGTRKAAKAEWNRVNALSEPLGILIAHHEKQEKTATRRAIQAKVIKIALPIVLAVGAIGGVCWHFGVFQDDSNKPTQSSLTGADTPEQPVMTPGVADRSLSERKGAANNGAVEFAQTCSVTQLDDCLAQYNKSGADAARTPGLLLERSKLGIGPKDGANPVCSAIGDPNVMMTSIKVVKKEVIQNKNGLQSTKYVLDVSALMPRDGKVRYSAKAGGRAKSAGDIAYENDAKLHRQEFVPGYSIVVEDGRIRLLQFGQVITDRPALPNSTATGSQVLPPAAKPN
ncbi:MAG: hypothetical protein AB7E52_02260, partial [Bdellovibrionales bacterium]